VNGGHIHKSDLTYEMQCVTGLPLNSSDFCAGASFLGALAYLAC